MGKLVGGDSSPRPRGELGAPFFLAVFCRLKVELGGEDLRAGEFDGEVGDVSEQRKMLFTKRVLWNSEFSIRCLRAQFHLNRLRQNGRDFHNVMAVDSAGSGRRQLG